MQEKIHNTYNRVKPPTRDVAKRTILFNFVTYFVPESAGSLFDQLFDQLNDAVTADSKDMGALAAALDDLEEYKVGVKVCPQGRQTEIYDPFDGKVIG